MSCKPTPYHSIHSAQRLSLASFSRHVRRLGILLLLVFLPGMAHPVFSATDTPGTEPIELLFEKLPFTSKEFYIANIIDEREDPSAVAWLITPGGQGGYQKVDLKGGGSAAILTFIQSSLPANNQLRPVTIRLKEFKITESPGGKGAVDGKISLSMDFEIERSGEPIFLTTYSGGARYTRAAAKTSLIEPTLRRSLISAIKYLNDWMDREAGRNINLARGVKVSITDFTENTERDTVFYSFDRPLVWQDFQATPNGGSRYAASIFPNFSYEGSSYIKDGLVHLNLCMKVYMLKNASWVKSTALDTYSLNHEQRHFDIVKLVVERFKEKLSTQSFAADDYDRIIAALYIEAYREMNHLQDQYDSETRHGINQAMQEQWNQKLDKELKLRTGLHNN